MSRLSILFFFILFLLILILNKQNKSKNLENFNNKLLREKINNKYNEGIEYHFQLYSYNGPPHYESKLINSTSYEVFEQKLLLYFLKDTDNVIELGANIGTSSILISKILKDSKNQHISVEPNKKILPILKENKILNKATFNIIPGIISPPGDFYLDNDGWAGNIVKYKTKQKVKTFDFYELDSKYNFNVLFADCEGSLVQLINDYPEIHIKLRLVIYEKDGNIDYSKVDNYFLKNNFNYLIKGFHCVLEKNNI
uniref:Methyltransferase FkbM domain-containing protein n=1 Tax=viral metagenome TaxID=1070528 RepID=A0A6C0J5U8_9ZZZZ